MSYAWFEIDGRQVYRAVRHHEPARSSLPCPMVISDHMDPTEHPCDGKLYESKAAFRRVTRENNCIEVGNDPARFRQPPKRKPDRKGIREAILKASNRVKNG